MKLSKNVQTTLSEFIRAAANLKNITDEAEKQLTDSEKKKVAFENALELAKDEYSKLKRKIGNYELEFNEKKTLAQKEVEEQKKQAGFFEETGKLSVPAMTKSMKELVRETAEWLDLVTVTAQKLPDLSAKMKETEDRIGALTKAAGVGPDAEKEREREREELQKKRIQTAQIVSDSMGQISDAFAEAEIAKANRVADRQRALAIRGVNQRINAIKKANTVGGKLTKRGLDLIEQAETEHQLSLGRINEKARAAESEALRKQKPSRIAEAVVNTAIAVTRALTIGPVLGPIAAAAIGAAGAAQIALIADQKFQRGGFSSGGAALVGEAGPELVNLPPGSKVFNNQQTNSIVNNGGGTTVQVILDGELIAEQLVRGSELGQNRLAIND